jgi:hypothetical protein
VLQKVLFDEAICEENQATTALLYSISSTQVLPYMHFSSNGSFVLDNLVALKTCCLEVAQLLFIFLVCLGFYSGPQAFTRHLEDYCYLSFVLFLHVEKQCHGRNGELMQPIGGYTCDLGGDNGCNGFWSDNQGSQVWQALT